MLNYNFISQKARESRIDNITIEREYWQILWLQRIYLTPRSRGMFFKGGTAIRFLFQSFRFSEDLDFTSTLNQKDCEGLINEVFNFFKNNGPSDIEIKKERVVQRLEDVSLRYRFLFLPENTSQKSSIRIDISLREKPQTKDESIIIPFDYPVSPYPLVVHLSAREILAEKIRALFIRKKPRDLFDVWFLMTKNVKVNEETILEKFKIYPQHSYSLKELKRIVEGYDENELKKDLNQFLPLPYRNFYKKLKQEVTEMLPNHVISLEGRHAGMTYEKQNPKEH